MPTINELLASLEEADAVSGTQKIAQETPAPSSVEEAKAALMATIQQSKTAAESEESNQSVIEKMASDIASAEQYAQRREAELYGAAIWDGFMKRANQFASLADNFEDEDYDDVEPYGKEASHEKTAEEYLVEGGQEALQRMATLNAAAFEYGFDKIANLLDAE